ncbi:MAG: hypothetical protein U5K69_06400 [Balneolaceae bacterium]|nr:hypothetical protein [Balneolaceae bacterium]
MKIQTNALLKSCSVDGNPVDLPDFHPIELEFSAVDTGGGFRDMILDFSFQVPNSNGVVVGEPVDKCEIVVTMQNPNDTGREVTFCYQGKLSSNDDDELEINGRLKDDMLSRELVGFMLHLLK